VRCIVGARHSRVNSRHPTAGTLQNAHPMGVRVARFGMIASTTRRSDERDAWGTLRDWVGDVSSKSLHSVGQQVVHTAKMGIQFLK
jgi:hypothetical protein